MARIHLIEGPVGAGKSTFAFDLGERVSAPCLVLDDWMANLFRPDRPSAGVMEWYIERKSRCLDQIWKVTCALMEAQSDVVLELGLVQSRDRHQFYDRVEASGYDLTVYVLEASREQRRARVQERNRAQGATFSMEVPDHFFELASDMWEEPDEVERSEREMRFISTES